jgi:ABC-type sugar transport system ATPase subunit
MLKTVNLSKKFDNFELKPLSFEIPQGSYAMIIGESGAGKTILIELLSGLRKPDSGTVYWNNADVSKIKPQDRKFAVVFQDGNLFPHMTVKKNILFPLMAKRIPSSEYGARLLLALEETGISHLLNRYPGQISGGERQRVALARALVSEAELILLDEPLSAVDVERRDDLVLLLKKVNQSGKTIIHITHNVEETFQLASHVVILNKGTLLQYGDLQSVSTNPRGAFVARLFGLLNYFESPDEKTIQLLSNLGIKHFSNAPVVLDPTMIKISLQPDDSKYQVSTEIVDVTKTTNGYNVKVATTPPLKVFIDNSRLLTDHFSQGKPVYVSCEKMNL